MEWIQVLGLLSLCAIVGGTAAWMADSLPSVSVQAAKAPQSPWLNWLKYLITAFVATFAVPLFLRLADSSLLDRVLDVGQQGHRPSDPWVLAGFGLIAAFVSKTFIQSLAKRLIDMAESANRTASRAEQTAEESKTRSTKTEEALENIDAPKLLSPTSIESGNMLSAENVKNIDELTEPERRVLDALASERFTRRTASGVAADAKINKSTARSILERLHRLGLVRVRVSEKTGNTLYERVW